MGGLNEDGWDLYKWVRIEDSGIGGLGDRRTRDKDQGPRTKSQGPRSKEQLREGPRVAGIEEREYGGSEEYTIYYQFNIYHLVSVVSSQ